MEYVILAAVITLLVSILSSFRPAVTSKIDENLFVVNCMFVNFYVLKINEKLVVFDTGTNRLFVKKGFKKLNLSPSDVTHIFLTHTDRDHAGGISAFPNALLFLSSEEEQMINGQTAKKLFIYNKKIKENYQLLENNDILEIDDVTIKIIITPGHTTGSSIYIIDDTICVTGDLLQITRKQKITQFMRLMNMNHKKNKESLDSVMGVLEDTKLILSGHTGILKKS